MTKINDFLDGMPFVVTEEHIKLPWNGKGHRGFCCGFCMHIFEPGETTRWVFVEGAPNTFVCVEHDGPDAAERFLDRWVTVIRPILDRWA